MLHPRDHVQHVVLPPAWVQICIQKCIHVELQKHTL